MFGSQYLADEASAREKVSREELQQRDSHKAVINRAVKQYPSGEESNLPVLPKTQSSSLRHSSFPIPSKITAVNLHADFLQPFSRDDAPVEVLTAVDDLDVSVDLIVGTVTAVTAAYERRERRELHFSRDVCVSIQNTIMWSLIMLHQLTKCLCEFLIHINCYSAVKHKVSICLSEHNKEVDEPQDADGQKQEVANLGHQENAEDIIAHSEHSIELPQKGQRSNPEGSNQRFIIQQCSQNIRVIYKGSYIVNTETSSTYQTNHSLTLHYFSPTKIYFKYK
ncbi:hypothetical protein DPX16_18533 [Anabarilius grahami]|uniref:Uncharacterized protein n=1 Tax=Anabarilius grahami TaxID=495550 RepID=A0A3N0YY21_ANAGA|nr:hypothetical protein DPX16_18533 [Anabarilius grahami]